MHLRLFVYGNGCIHVYLMLIHMGSLLPGSQASTKTSSGLELVTVHTNINLLPSALRNVKDSVAAVLSGLLMRCVCFGWRGSVGGSVCEHVAWGPV